MEENNTENTNETVSGPPPEKCIGERISLPKRLILGSVMSVVVIIMLSVVVWIIDRLTH